MTRTVFIFFRLLELKDIPSTNTNEERIREKRVLSSGWKEIDKQYSATIFKIGEVGQQMDGHLQSVGYWENFLLH